MSVVSGAAEHFTKSHLANCAVCQRYNNIPALNETKWKPCLVVCDLVAGGRGPLVVYSAHKIRSHRLGRRHRGDVRLASRASNYRPGRYFTGWVDVRLRNQCEPRKELEVEVRRCRKVLGSV